MNNLPQQNRTDDIYEPQYVQGLFNRMSQSYERVNYLTSFGFSLRWRRQFLNHFKSTNKPTDSIKIIDIMTGMGETWHPVKKRYPKADFTALDFSKGMLNYAAKKNGKKFENSVHLVLENMLANQLPSNHFDIVICAFGIKTFNLEQQKRLAKEVFRILKPNGQFSFIEVSEPKNTFLQFLYQLHLSQVVPIFGKILLGNPTEYRMLWKYTSKFKNAKKAASYFQAAGLQTTYTEYFYGCATGFYGTKMQK